MKLEYAMFAVAASLLPTVAGAQTTLYQQAVGNTGRYHISSGTWTNGNETQYAWVSDPSTGTVRFQQMFGPMMATPTLLLFGDRTLPWAPLTPSCNSGYDLFTGLPTYWAYHVFTGAPGVPNSVYLSFPVGATHFRWQQVQLDLTQTCYKDISRAYDCSVIRL